MRNVIVTTPVELTNAMKDKHIAVGSGSSAVFFAASLPLIADASGLNISVVIVLSSVGLMAMSVLFDEYMHVELGPNKLLFERKHKN